MRDETQIGHDELPCGFEVTLRPERLDQPLRPESASDVRMRMATGGDWRALLPPPVAARIAAEGLYGMSPA